MSVETIPAGFRRSVDSGLILPEAVSRERIVYSREDWKAIDRATKLLSAMNIRVFFKCEHSACQAAPMERMRRSDGGLTLRCPHADREFWPV